MGGTWPAWPWAVRSETLPKADALAGLLTLTDVGATMRDAMLDARVDRLEATIERLANAQAQTQADLRTLVVTVKNLVDAVADLKGDQFERHYREHADAYFAPLLNRLRVLSVEERSSLAATPATSGRCRPKRLMISYDRTRSFVARVPVEAICSLWLKSRLLSTRGT